jgi:hypothetical protein
MRVSSAIRVTRADGLCWLNAMGIGGEVSGGRRGDVFH